MLNTLMLTKQFYNIVERFCITDINDQIKMPLLYSKQTILKLITEWDWQASEALFRLCFSLIIQGVRQMWGNKFRSDSLG